MNPFESAVNIEQALEYERIRPSYPSEVFERVVDLAGGDEATVVDVGAGTGQFTRGMVARGIHTIAVEPSPAMRTVLTTQDWAKNAAPLLEVRPGTAEDLPVDSGIAGAVVWAQCSHWLDIPRAAAEAARVMTFKGSLCLVANQLAVEIPWVHRLSRIMRSGDVVRRDRTPPLGPLFTTPTLFEVAWAQEITVDQCLELARTRSSYLQADEARKAKMQQNLSWYLLEHLGFDSVAPFSLPYTTMMWTAQKAG